MSALHAGVAALPIRRVAGWPALAAVLLAVGLFTAMSSLPSGDGILKAAAPASAEAWQGGWDRDHFWIKLTRAEVAAGAATAVCARVAGRVAFVCPALGWWAGRSVGRGGWWAEIWLNGHYRYGAW